MTTLTGLEFNNYYHNEIFYKLTDKNEIHNGLQLKTGLNENLLFSNGGLNFTEKDNIGLWLECNSKLNYWIRQVTIPDDAIVREEWGCYKANDIILGERIAIKDRKDLFKTMIKKNPIALFYIDDLTEEICDFAFKIYENALTYIKPNLITYEICKIAVKKRGLALQYIAEPFRTEEICKIAIENNVHAAMYIPTKLQNIDIKKSVVNSSGTSLYMFKEQLEEICKIAVQQNGLSLCLVDPIYKTTEICNLAVQQNASALEYVDYNLQTYDMCKIAVAADGMTLKFVKIDLQTEELCLIALKDNKKAFQFVDSKCLTYKIFEFINDSNAINKINTINNMEIISI